MYWYSCFIILVEVVRLFIILISFIIGVGLKKCSLVICFGFLILVVIVVIEIDEVLLVNSVDGV